jgi:hypothetical protein
LGYIYSRPFFRLVHFAIFPQCEFTTNIPPFALKFCPSVASVAYLVGISPLVTGIRGFRRARRSLLASLWRNRTGWLRLQAKTPKMLSLNIRWAYAVILLQPARGQRVAPSPSKSTKRCPPTVKGVLYRPPLAPYIYFDDAAWWNLQYLSILCGGVCNPAFEALRGSKTISSTIYSLPKTCIYSQTRKKDFSLWPRWSTFKENIFQNWNRRYIHLTISKIPFLFKSNPNLTLKRAHILATKKSMNMPI